MRLINHPSTALAAAALLLAPAITAQQLDSLTVGARIRVQRIAPVWTVVRGTYVTRDSISFALDERGEAYSRLSVPVLEVRAVEMVVRRRTAGQAFGRGAGFGAVAGASVSAVLMVIAVRSDARSTGDEWISSSAVAGVFSVLLTGVTTLVGGGLGMLDRDIWKPVPFRP
jgi:hypothetical protein